MKFAINCLLTEKLLRVKWKPAPVQLLETSVQTLIRSWWLQLLHHYSTLVQWLERYIVTVEITSSILVCTAKILKVDRVTSTTIVCGSEKFRKQNGRQIPADTWGSSYISVLTESLKNQYYEMIRKKQLITKIKSVDLFQLSVDSLQQISDVIQNSMTDENT